MLKTHRYNKKHHKSGSSSDMGLQKPLPYRIMQNSSIGMIAFLITFISFSAFSPVENTDATEVLSALSNSGNAVSISTSANAINLSVAADSTGSVRTASDTVSVTAGNNGYQLYLSASENTNALIRDGATSTGTDAAGAPTYASTDIIPTLTSSDNLIPITNPTNLENNTWGFAVPAKNTSSESSGSYDVVSTAAFDSTYPVGNNSSASSKFASVPTKGNDILIAKRSSSADAVPTNFYYGIKATTSKPSGLYQNTITYTAIGDSSINGLASVTPERTNQLTGGITLDIATPSTLALNSISSISVTIGGQTCDHATAYKNDFLVNITCTSPSLATGWHGVIATITATSDTTETYVVNPGIEYYSDVQTLAMQDFTVTECVAMNTLESITLIDSRDQNTYRVTKQADGNCWMTENLRLGNNPDSTGIIANSIILTPNDSDIPADGTNFTIDPTLIQTSAFVPTGYDTNWDDSNWDKERIYSFTADSDNTTSAANKRAYGNLYNWYTATAGTGTHTGTVGGRDATASICPKGWKLPPKTGNGSYTALMQSQIPGIPVSDANTTYTDAFQQSPLNFVLSGYYNSNSADYGVFSVYWSRTSDSSYNDGATNFYFISTSGLFYLQAYASKFGGRSVRCVLPTTMQNFSSLACTNLKTAQTITLTDSRDLNTYAVTKQADGNCWMTENLRLGNNPTSTAVMTQNITLDSSNSDIPTTLKAANGTDPYSFMVGPTLIQTSSHAPTGYSTDWSNDGDWDKGHIYSFTADSDDITSTADKQAYGNLYNWYTATAGTGTKTGVASGDDAPASICPKGWHLPPDTGNGSYDTLIRSQFPNIPDRAVDTTYTSLFKQAPLNLVTPGFYNDTNLAYHNDCGTYWSRTVYNLQNAEHAFGFYFYGDGDFSLHNEFGLHNSNQKSMGRSVRCYFAN